VCLAAACLPEGNDRADSAFHDVADDVGAVLAKNVLLSAVAVLGTVEFVLFLTWVLLALQILLLADEVHVVPVCETRI